MEPEKKSPGALIGSIVVIVILIIGGIYIWQTKAKQMKLEKEKAVLEQRIQEEDIQGLDSLEQELNTVDISVGVDINSLE